MDESIFFAWDSKEWERQKSPGYMKGMIMREHGEKSEDMKMEMTWDKVRGVKGLKSPVGLRLVRVGLFEKVNLKVERCF